MDKVTIKGRVAVIARIVFFCFLVVFLLALMLGAALLGAWALQGLVTLAVGHAVGKFWMYSVVTLVIILAGVTWSELPTRKR